MRELDDVLRERGAAEGPPPIVLGHRGAPRLAPENTLSSLRRALELGLDGVEYDVQGARGGDPVLLHDVTLGRTTDGHGSVEEASLTELAGLDAGAWFGKAFTGEPLPLLEEALELDGQGIGEAPLHMIELKRPDLVARVSSALASLPRPLPVRIASFYREVCLEATDQGLPAMLLSVRANEDDRRFVRDERIRAYGVAAFGWRNQAALADWSCERWAWTVNRPDELLEACRRPLYGFNTDEPLRALSVRALVAATPEDEGDYPLEVPELEIYPATLGSEDADGDRRGGDWTGDWSFSAFVRNPFAHRVGVELGFRSRRGAFEISGGPTEFSLEPGERKEARLRLVGGSFSPGLEPLLQARYSSAPAAMGSAEALVLDAPIERIRRVVARDVAVRLEALRESPGQRPASFAMRRRGAELVCEIEDDGGLAEAQIHVHLDGETYPGSRGLRLRLPRDFDLRPEGLRFTVALTGFDPDGDPRRVVVRRWAGGFPGGGLAGNPGRLLPRPPGSER